MDRLQPVDGHVGVKLGRCERSVTKQLLNATEVRSPFEQMGRGRMAQAMRSDLGGSRHRVDRVMHNAARSALIQPATAHAEEHRVARTLGAQFRATGRQPAPERLIRRYPERHGPFPVTLAQHAHRSEISS